MIAENWNRSPRRIGLFPANTVTTMTSRFYGEEGETLMNLATTCASRCQARGQAQLVPGDFVAPKDRASGTAGIGAFVVTAGHSTRRLRSRHSNAARRLQRHPVQVRSATASRKACAERLHQRVPEFWGYAADEALHTAQLVNEEYRGIRPAPAIRPARSTARKAACSPCSTPRRGSASASPRTTP